MYEVTGTMFLRKFGDIGQRAQRETVKVTNHGRAHFYAIPSEEYERLRSLDRKVYLAAEMPESLRTAIAAAKPSRKSRRFNREVGG